jgi:sterol-4alpha-carboxylate 3-dehydrogenase (decarboxylating)
MFLRAVLPSTSRHGKCGCIRGSACGELFISIVTRTLSKALRQVIGGSGFLGSTIIRQLLQRGEKLVYNFDVRQPSAAMGIDASSFFKIDITSRRSVFTAFEEVKPEVVYHTVSPLAVGTQDRKVFELVNVKGTSIVIEACQRNDVKKLVFTSSSGVVFDGSDNINIDERMPYPEKAMDLYNDTKARAEQLVIQANTDVGTEGLKTVSLRPASIFGPHDRQMVPAYIEALKAGRTNFQIGDNKNLVDFTYVDNIAHAHLLAADKLSASNKPYPTEMLGSTHLSDRITGTNEKESFLERGVPTSKDRPDVAGVTDYARQLPKTAAEESATCDMRPVIRNKYDQFFHLVNPEVKSAGNPMPDVVNIADEELPVAGQIFFITNGTPIPFWDLSRAIWKEYDPEKGVVDPAKCWKLSKSVSLLAAGFLKLLSYSTGRPPTIDHFKVTVICGTRYHNIEKARRLLGYEPLIGLEEGIKRSVEWFKALEAEQHFDD